MVKIFKLSGEFSFQFTFPFLQTSGYQRVKRQYQNLPSYIPTYTGPATTSTTTTTTTTTTTASPRIVYRTFGYRCRITVSIDVCYIGTECDAYGNKLKSKNR